METASASDAFHLGRLRLVRLPPSWIQLPRGSRKPLAVPVELAVGLTDDYGVDLMLDSLDLQIKVLDADTLSAPIGVALQLDGASSFSSSPPKNIAFFTFNPSRGPFQTLKLFLIFSPSASTCSIPSKLSFRLSVRPRPTSSPSSSRFDGSDCSTATRRIRQILGETEQEAVETWDEKSYVLMSLTSGAVEVRSEGKEVKVAGTKVQTALRTLYLPASTPSSSEPTASLPPLPSSPSPPPAPQQITIVERPGLNNSTGQRLWDCAIGLSAFFSLVPDALDAAFPLPSLPSPPSSSDSKVASPPPAQRPCCLASPPPAKRPRTSPSLVRRGRRRVIELGAGCALASLAAQRLGGTDVEIVATDIEATVNTTLRENLEVNRQLGEGGKGEEIQSEVLNWGELSPERVAALTAGGSTSPVVSVTLIATDVLYDPDTHSLLLSTLLSFLRPSPSSSSPSPDAPLPSRRALIAYKRRTDGDDGFFARAERAGLAVRKVWDWGEVGVWAFA